MSKLQPAIRKETINVALYCLIGTILMCVVFLIWHQIYPDKVPFDYTIILGGIGGSAISILNFFLMAMTVQKVVLVTDADQAKKMLKFSYTRRFFLQIAWCVAVIFAPCFQLVAGLLPLLFPSLGIKGRAIFFRKSFKNDPLPAQTAPAASKSTEENPLADTSSAAPAESTNSASDSDNNDDNHLSFREI